MSPPSASTAKRLLERTSGEHPIISLVFDLDPSEFATAPARTTQTNSLMDGVHNLVEADQTLSHDARQFARGDVERLREYLSSDDLPVSGAGALAIFASEGDGLFETIALAATAPSQAYFGRHPHLEAIVTARVARPWCAVLVSVRDVTVDRGLGTVTATRTTGTDYVRGHAESDGNDQYSRHQDIEDHLNAVARQLAEDHQAGRFQVLVIGGPVEALSALEKRLTDDLRAVLAPRLDIDPSTATEADVAAGVDALLAAQDEQEQAETLARFADQLAAGDRQESGLRAVAGVADVLEALTEQRVATLLLAGDFHAAGARCPHDGMLLPFNVSTCPVDGSATAPVDDLREPMIAAAVRQDAPVLVFPEPGEVLGAPDHQVGALLRF
jgi:hypothetical protein